MSSHHIVRDEQEPAILITEVKKQYWPGIEQLLGWIPTVIVDENCVNDVLLRGFKIDIVICQEQNLTALKELLQDQQPIKFLLKEKGDIVEVAVKYLDSRGYKGVNIFGGFDPTKSLSINRQITAIWYDAEYRYVLSKKTIFQKWMTANNMFCLKKTESNQSFNIENADKVDNANVYRCSSDGKVKILSESDFWLGEELRQ